ncbi:hypothetical protein Hanom_Chr16g01497161 [Helianthus anomalus]
MPCNLKPTSSKIVEIINAQIYEINNTISSSSSSNDYIQLSFQFQFKPKPKPKHNPSTKTHQLTN